MMKRRELRLGVFGSSSVGLLALVLACSPSNDDPPSDKPGDEETGDLELQIEESDPEDLAFGDGGDGDGDGDGDGVGDFGDGDYASGTGGSTSAFGGAGGEFIGEPVDPKPIDHPPLDPDDLTYGDLTAGMFDDNRSFDFFRIYQDGIHANYWGLMPFTLEDDYLPVREAYLEAQRPHDKLDISIVLDTTGSMGDEITYLQGEFLGLSGEIKKLYPNAEQRWSLVVYRDTGPEEYLFRTTEFSSELSVFHDSLLRQRAGGGGDFPEAPDVGLSEAGKLDWRDGDDVARMIFWVADAPHHEENAQAMAEAIGAARKQDIHIYPIGASGLDEFTEFTMRASAQLTMGRYIFLTSDSGLGGEHKEPTLPCYYVTTLSDAILRGIEAEMTGEYRLPDEDAIIRKEGSFSREGMCSYGERSETLTF